MPFFGAGGGPPSTGEPPAEEPPSDAQASADGDEPGDTGDGADAGDEPPSEEELRVVGLCEVDVKHFGPIKLWEPNVLDNLKKNARGPGIYVIKVGLNDHYVGIAERDIYRSLQSLERFRSPQNHAPGKRIALD